MLSIIWINRAGPWLVVAAMLCLRVCGQEPLNHIGEMKMMTPAEASSFHPVRFRGVVSGNREITFLQDDTGATFVSGFDATNALPGMLVEIEGYANPGQFATCVTGGPGKWTPVRTRVLGPGVLPEPEELSANELVRGRMDARFVAVTGVLRSDGNGLPITLKVGAETIPIRLPPGEHLPGQFTVGSKVRVVGAYGVRFNSRRQLIGIAIWASGSEAFTLLNAAAADPFALPLSTVASIGQFSTDDPSERYRIVGQVICHRRGRGFYVSDGTGTVWVGSAATNIPALGQIVETVGYPSGQRFSLSLDGPVYRVHGMRPLPAPKDLGTTLPTLTVGQDNLLSTPDGELVRVRATVVEVSKGARYTTILLQSGEQIVTAELAHLPNKPSPVDVRPGSLVSVAGVCEVQVDESHRPQTVRLLMRDESDLVLLEKPKWLTPERLAAFLGGGGLAAVIVLVWVWILHRKKAELTELLEQRQRAEAALTRAHQELEQRVAERTEELRHQQEFMRSVIDLIPGFVFAKDYNGRFLLVSKGLADHHGFPAEYLIGKTDREIMLNPDEADPIMADDREVMASGKEKVIPAELITDRFGARRWLQTVKRPMRCIDGSIGVAGLAMDITARKEAEEQLAHARDDAEAASRAKSMFLANMSHEIRTPMNGVIGMISLLLDTPLNTEQREFASTVRSCADSLLTIINDILDFSKIEAGRLQFDEVDFDLADTVESSIEILAEPAHAKGIEIASLIRREVPRNLRGDPGRIRQVLLNLISNGVKFTERGEVVVEIGVRGATETHTEIHVSVRDTGIGMDRDTASKLFTAFTQADASTTRRFGGTGLGLAICKRLVEMMDGAIGVESEPGRGSCFWFTMKLAHALNPVVETSSFHSLNGIRVMVVDDNETNRRILQYQLAGWHLNDGGSVGSASAALDLLRQSARLGNPVDVAILDYHMPGMDGLQLARAIKADPLISQTQLLVLTSMCQRLQPLEMRAAGIATWLVKPVRPSLLHDSLAKMAAASEPAADPAAAIAGPAAVEDAGETAEDGGPDERPAVRVLIAEDNVVNQKVAQRHLAKLGLRADIVANGLEALDALRRIRYDLVLMDCQMPELDGYEATRRIRRGESGNPNVPIVAMTANAMHGDKERCMEAGMDDYIAKPVRQKELHALLERWLPRVFGASEAPVAA
jgi:two-component system sensor histidine kinase/response regulator